MLEQNRLIGLLLLAFLFGLVLPFAQFVAPDGGKPLTDLTEPEAVNAPPACLYLRLDGLDHPTLERLTSLSKEDSPLEWLPLSELSKPLNSHAALIDWRGGSRLRKFWLMTALLSEDDSLSPSLAGLLDNYAETGLKLAGKELLRGEGWLVEEAERLERGSRAVAALLDSGEETIYWQSDLFLRYYDRLWCFVQRYRELAWEHIYPTMARVAPEERGLVVLYGELVESFIVTLDGFLGDLKASHPGLRIVITSGCGYGAIRPENLSTPPWGAIELD
ncbi:hypothetical protein K8R78_00260 [bacterium]|nr:hypothetical protein [bacterium]